MANKGVTELHGSLGETVAGGCGIGYQISSCESGEGVYQVSPVIMPGKMLLS
jgi:hypothetical protein